jgi:hypothetical protein
LTISERCAGGAELAIKIVGGYADRWSAVDIDDAANSERNAFS